MRGKALSLHRFEVCWATERKPVTCYDYQSTPHWIRCWPCFRSYLRKQGRNDASCRAVMVDHVSKNLSVSSFSTTFQIVESNSVTEPGCPFFFFFLRDADTLACTFGNFLLDWVSPANITAKNINICSPGSLLCHSTWLALEQVFLSCGRVLNPWSAPRLFSYCLVSHDIVKIIILTGESPSQQISQSSFRGQLT